MPRDQSRPDVAGAVLPLISIVLAMGAVMGCQQGAETPVPVPKVEVATPEPSAPFMAVADDEALGYATDLDNICHAIERSGASGVSNYDRVVMSAQWLGNALTTDAGRNFMAQFASMDPNTKGESLRLEAARVGVDECPLAAEWTSAVPATPAG